MTFRCLLFGRGYTRYFTYIIQFNLPNNFVGIYHYLHFAAKETEFQRS